MRKKKDNHLRAILYFIFTIFELIYGIFKSLVPAFIFALLFRDQISVDPALSFIFVIIALGGISINIGIADMIREGDIENG